MEWFLDKIVNQLRICPFNPQIIYINFNTYNKLQEEIQEMQLDYNSSTILALGNIQLVIDLDLKDNEIKIE